MKIFLSGISCVGKTTIGKQLADNLGYDFYDLDEEIEKYFGRTYNRAHLKIDISGLDIEKSVLKVVQLSNEKHLLLNQH